MLQALDKSALPRCWGELLLSHRGKCSVDVQCPGGWRTGSVKRAYPGEGPGAGSVASRTLSSSMYSGEGQMEEPVSAVERTGRGMGVSQSCLLVEGLSPIG